jgi:hypothetical protein
MAEVAAPDVILRAEAPGDAMPILRPGLPPFAPDIAPGLAEIYDSEIEAAARAAFARDYMTFGYGNWR